ncbi:MAG: hypothetical protein M3076_19060 [Actinomycetota bacterium]|nr:hypothetical protein [Actinomycetota bacterium]
MSLLAALDAKREHSFESFAASCSTRLLRAAYLLCGDRQTAEDLLQMTMVRTARRWSAARTSPEAYARTVLVNLARDHARRGRRRVARCSVMGRVPWATSADSWQTLRTWSHPGTLFWGRSQGCRSASVK